MIVEKYHYFIHDCYKLTWREFNNVLFPQSEVSMAPLSDEEYFAFWNSKALYKDPDTGVTRKYRKDELLKLGAAWKVRREAKRRRKLEAAMAKKKKGRSSRGMGRPVRH